MGEKRTGKKRKKKKRERNREQIIGNWICTTHKKNDVKKNNKSMVQSGTEPLRGV